MVGSADDPLEREAERVADLVVAGSLDTATGAAMSGGGPTRIAPSVAGRISPRGEPIDSKAESRIRASSGRPLDHGIREDMERSFGANLSDVRLHAGSTAAPALGTLAFTVGADVHLSPDAPNLGSREGRRLLAHELAHVIQQGAAVTDQTVNRIQRAPHRTGGEPSPNAPANVVQCRRLKQSELTVIETFTSGSTAPQLVRLSDGTLKVLKQGKDSAHVRTEVLAQKLYEAAGIRTLPTELVELEKTDGETVAAQLTEYVGTLEAGEPTPSFKVPDLADLCGSPDFYRHAAADMIFANWDLFKLDNWMEIDGRMVRADLGGALDRRAQGDPKDPGDWSGKVGEFESMRAKDERKNPYKPLTDRELADSVRTLLANLSINQIQAAFEEVGLDIEHDAKELFNTVVKRMDDAAAWADRVYPLNDTVKTTELTNTTPSLPTQESSDDDLDPWQLLQEAGYQLNGPVQYRCAEKLRDLFSRQITTKAVGDEGGWMMSLDGWPNVIIPPEPKRSDETRHLPPMTGPEELLQDDQFSEEMRGKMPKWFSRMRAGRLVRRMSDQEREAWIASAQSGDINTIANLLFGDFRGEMVLSINDPYIFDRERAEFTGATYTPTDEDTKHPPENYRWVMEIPITEKMLQFLRDYAYINTPSTGKKISSFSGNPTVKTEGAAGGRRNAEGIPNVVIKQLGLAEFWSSIRSFTFVLADQHVWKQRSSNKELIEAREEQQRRERQEAVSKRRREQKAQEASDDDDIGLSWLMEEQLDNASDTATTFTQGDLVLVEHKRGEWTVVAIDHINGTTATLKLDNMRWDVPLNELVGAPTDKQLGDRVPKV